MRSIAAATLAVLALLVTPPVVALAAEGWRWPVQGELLTRYSNGSDPYAGGQHRGIDIAAPEGTPVVAPTAGTVTWAGTAGSSGLTVSLRTADGRFDLSFLHLSSASVAKGDRVSTAHRVGAVGVSGRRSNSRAHLHFGVRTAGSTHGYVDPLGLLGSPPVVTEPPRAVPVTAPAPARPGGAPVRVPAPTTRPAPVRRPALRPRPARRPAPGARRPRVSSPAARSAPVARPTGAATGAKVAPSRARAGQLATVDDARQVRASARPGSSLESAPGHARPSAEESASVSAAERPRATSGGGLDLGWLVACAGAGLAGLALLAGTRGGPRGALDAVHHARSILARPLFGRR